MLNTAQEHEVGYFLHPEVVFNDILGFLIFTLLLWSSGPARCEQCGTESGTANMAQVTIPLTVRTQKGWILWEVPTAFTAAWLEEAVDTNLFQARLLLTHLDWEQVFQTLNKEKAFEGMTVLNEYAKKPRALLWWRESLTCRQDTVQDHF